MKILYFSPIYWDFLKQRPQHIAEELSKTHSVYYVEPSISIISSIINRNHAYKPREFNVNTNLRVIRPSGRHRLPKIIDLFDFIGLNLASERRSLMQQVKKADLIWLGSPIFYGLVKNLGKKIIYDKMDDYEKLTKSVLLRKLIKKNEKGLISKAILTFTSSQFLYNQIQDQGKPVALVRNGLDKTLLNIGDHGGNQISTLKKIKGDGSLIFGYIGTIDHWFDYNAIKQILAHNKKNKVVMVGHNNIPRYNHENLYYFDAVPKNELGSIINQFDYCLYTFVRDALLDSIDPVKIYEYLSFNKKIIAVESAETKRFEEYIKLYADNISLGKLLNELEGIKAPFSNDELVKFINNNSWDKRTNSMNEYIKRIN